VTTWSALEQGLEQEATGIIGLEISPYVSADTVRQFYLHIQQHASVGRTQQETARGAADLRFVLEQTGGEDPTGRWPELQEGWNAAHPAWLYEDSGGLRKAYHRAYQRIIEPMR
jgi:hypothetical protein